MDFKRLKTVLTRFLSEEAPSAVLIFGDWGTGKTHFWDAFIKAFAKSERHPRRASYAYVSLFGIDSMETLKRRVLEQLVSMEGGIAESSLKNLLKNLNSSVNVDNLKRFGGQLGRVRNVAKSLKGVPGIGQFIEPLAHLLESASVLEVRNAVICVDDIERISEKVAIGDVLGYFSFLVHERNCKVIAIADPPKLVDQDGFKLRYEKVFDYSVAFSPTVAEVVEIAFPVQNEADKAYIEVARDAVTRLDITNLRTLFKAGRVVDYLMTRCKQRSTDTVYQVVTSAVLFVWSNDGTTDERPSLKFLETQTIEGIVRFEVRRNGDSEEATRHADWASKLRQYGFSHLDDLDAVILIFVRDGFLDDNRFETCLNALDDNASKRKLKEPYEKAWTAYTRTLDHGGLVLAEELLRTGITAAAEISASDIAGVYDELAKILPIRKAKKLLQAVCDSRPDGDPYFNLASYPWIDQINPSVREKFAQKYERGATAPTFESAWENLLEHGTAAMALERVAMASVDEITVWVRKTPLQNLRGLVKDIVIPSRNYPEFPTPHKLLAGKLIRALAKIARRSKVHRRQVLRLGITPEELGGSASTGRGTTTP